MHFNDYLIYYQKKNKIKSASSLFKILGGEKKLEIKLRNFLQIYSQERHPSLKVFLKILEQLPLEEYKSAIISFFSTAGNSTKQSNKLLNYLEKNLTVAIDKKSPSIWDKVDSVRVLNDVQLKYLNSNPEALRFFNLLLLKENLSIKYFKSKEHILKKLEELELVKLKSNGTIERPYHGIRVPIPKISPRPLAQAGLDYIYNHIHNYSSAEKTETQKVCYSIQSIHKEHLPIVIEHMENTHKWLAGLAEIEENHDDLIPLVFVSFTKGLSWDDF